MPEKGGPGFRLERALAPLFPRWAARRVQQRVALDMALRAYDAAKPSRSTRHWSAPSTSAREEIEGALESLRNRSRDLARNNPWAAKAARMLPAHMVGTGVTPRGTRGADTTRRRAAAAWEAWAAESDQDTGGGFGLQQSMACRTMVESGEALLLWTLDGNAVGGWRAQVLEPDYLDETYTETSRNGSGDIINGIEYSADRARRVAYWLWREHPGDVGWKLRRSGERVRVPAAFVDHLFEPLRPGQTRGVPWLAASALRLRDMDDYLEAERWRKKVSAAFAAFVTTPQAPAGSPLGAQRTESDGAGATGIEKIMPGTIKRLVPGEEIEFPTTPSDSGVEAYLRWELFAIAAGVGVPYAELTGDLSNANYSSMRAGKIEFWALLDTWQWNVLAPMMLRRAWARVQATSGVPGMPAEWAFPRRAWVDPEKDVESEIKAIRAGLISQPDAIAGRGFDWRDVQREQAEFNAGADQAGLVFDTDPRKTARSGAASAAPAAPGSNDGRGPTP